MIMDWPHMEGGEKRTLANQFILNRLANEYDYLE